MVDDEPEKEYEAQRRIETIRQLIREAMFRQNAVDALDAAREQH